MKEVVISTESMIRFDETVDLMLSQGRMASGFIVAHGKAGRGKSVAADRYYVNRGGAYVRVWQGWTQTAFLQKLLFEVRGQNVAMPKHSSSVCKEKIIDLLREKLNPAPIFIDEADRLHVDRIEDLRDIHEETAVPIILIGEPPIFNLLETRARIKSRIVYEIEFTPLTASEVSIYANKASNLVIPLDLCGVLTKQADGDFRVVRNICLALEKFCKANSADSVNKDMLNEAISSVLKRG